MIQQQIRTHRGTTTKQAYAKQHGVSVKAITEAEAGKCSLSLYSKVFGPNDYPVKGDTITAWQYDREHFLLRSYHHFDVVKATEDVVECTCGDMVEGVLGGLEPEHELVLPRDKWNFEIVEADLTN
jgi:hypothetical protein